mmetsp:Transcript_8797/g.19311  ORF Transcript_8797/g.19311 Transcript_8797/m.19311 type:complete len:279 (-) Transcript_8797:67-903(-)
MSWFSRFRAQAPSFKEGSESRQALKESTFLFLALCGVDNYGVGIQKCSGPSMLPTLPITDEFVFLSIFPYVFLGQDYKVGDVVISKSKEGPETEHKVCKRVRAVAGDVVKYHYKGVKRIQKIPEHHVWLQGDNSENSLDSRYYGPVPVSLIRGRVFWKISNGLPFHCVHIDTPTGLNRPFLASSDPDLKLVTADSKDRVAPKEWYAASGFGGEAIALAEGKDNRADSASNGSSGIPNRSVSSASASSNRASSNRTSSGSASSSNASSGSASHGSASSP